MSDTPPRSRRRRPRPTHVRALALVADAGAEGVTEALMLAHGFTIELMVALVREELVAVTPQRIRAGGKMMEVAVLRITDKGRRAAAKAER